MMGTTHIAGGTALWLGLCLANPQPARVIVAGAAVAAIGALAPDIDHEHSMARSCLGPITIGLSWLIRTGGGGQRRITHCLIGLAAVALGLHYAAAAWHWAAWVQPAILTGWISHMILDGCTEQGIPLLWPVMTRFGLPRDLAITTGGRKDSKGRRPKWSLEHVVWMPALLVANAVAAAYAVVHIVNH